MNRNKCFSCSWCQPLSSTKQVSIFGTLKYSVQLTAFYTGRKSGTVICFVQGAATASIGLRAVQTHYFILSPEIICLEELYGKEYCRKWEGFYFVKRRKLLQLPNDRLLTEDQSVWFLFLGHRAGISQVASTGWFSSADLKWAPLDLRKVKTVFPSQPQVKFLPGQQMQCWSFCADIGP